MICLGPCPIENILTIAIVLSVEDCGSFELSIAPYCQVARAPSTSSSDGAAHFESMKVSVVAEGKVGTRHAVPGITGNVVHPFEYLDMIRCKGHEENALLWLSNRYHFHHSRSL